MNARFMLWSIYFDIISIPIGERSICLVSSVVRHIVPPSVGMEPFTHVVSLDKEPVTEA